MRAAELLSLHEMVLCTWNVFGRGVLTKHQDKLSDILRKTEVSFVSCHVLYCGNAKLSPTEILVSFKFFLF